MNEVIFPSDFDDFVYEAEAKGYLPGLTAVSGSLRFEFTAYDKVRLAQEIEDGILSDGYFVESNVLIVPKVSREAIVGFLRRSRQLRSL